MNVFAFTWIDKADKHSCKDLFLFLVFLSLSCFWVVSKWRKSIERTHETQKTLSFFPIVSTQTFCIVESPKIKIRIVDVKIDRDHLQLQTYFKEENKAIQELTCVKDVLLLFLYVQKWVKKKKKETLLNLHGETEVFNKWSKNLANL